MASNADSPEIAATAVATGGAAHWQRIESRLLRMGDYLNPILVKETRQALKSRYFTVTFGLVLATQWICTILWLAVEGSAAYYSARGADLFYFYYIILGVPLAVIIPFATYRSLQAEREDNTYELLSITALSARQIIAGKMGSALLQMVLFFSASVPCLAFTYLLRGIDILTIGLLLYYALFASVTLSVLGIFFATLTIHRFAQVLLSIVLIMALVWAYFMGFVAGSWGFLSEAVREYSSVEFWIANGIISTVDFTSVGMLFLAAAAMISFPTENRSTALRWGMLVQHACIAGWCAFFWQYFSPDLEGCLALMTVLGIYWYLMGALMSGESRHMSERAKRDLPQSFFGRVFLTWFNPGPMTGYVFTIVNLTSGLLLGCLGILFVYLEGNAGTSPTSGETFRFMVLLVSYVVIYLGVGNLILSPLRSPTRVGWFHSVVVQIILLLVLCLAPWVLQLMTFNGSARWDYSFLQIGNPFWSMIHVMDRGSVLFWFVPAVALIVFYCNLRPILDDVREVRILRPRRVQEEDAAMLPIETEPAGPWDD